MNSEHRATWPRCFLQAVTEVEPLETRAVFVHFFFLMRPLRETMGTVYGMNHLQAPFTGTFVFSFIVAPIYAGFVSRIPLATFLPWVYGFIAVTLVGFYFRRCALGDIRLGSINLLVSYPGCSWATV